MAERPRVVHVTTLHPTDDIRILRKECSTLAAAGYDVRLIAPARGRPASDPRVRVTLLPTWRSRLARMTLGTLRAFREALAQRADLYHLHDPELLPAGLALRLLGRRVIFDAHEDTPSQILSKSWLPAPLRRIAAGVTAGVEWLAGRCLTGVIAATPAIAGRYPAGRVRLVQNLPFRDELGPGPEAGGARDAFLYAGGLTRIRGLREMVAAAGLARARHPEIVLRLAGEFTPSGLADEARRWPGWEAVEYLGHLDRAALGREMGRALAGLVLFLPEPNHVSAQPNKLFEYMSAGIPVIASDFPLWRQLIGAAGAGVLVDPRDPAAIAEAMGRVFEDRELARRMGAAGRRLVVEQANWETESGHLLAAYAMWLRRPAQIGGGTSK